MLGCDPGDMGSTPIPHPKMNTRRMKPAVLTDYTDGSLIVSCIDYHFLVCAECEHRFYCYTIGKQFKTPYDFSLKDENGKDISNKINNRDVERGFGLENWNSDIIIVSGITWA